MNRLELEDWTDDTEHHRPSVVEDPGMSEKLRMEEAGVGNGNS